jgi:hypothetical protein
MKTSSNLETRRQERANQENRNRGNKKRIYETENNNFPAFLLSLFDLFFLVFDYRASIRKKPVAWTQILPGNQESRNGISEIEGKAARVAAKE